MKSIVDGRPLLKEEIDKIAEVAGIAGLLYIFGTKTLLPNFQNKITTLINQWFDGK